MEILRSADKSIRLPTSFVLEIHMALSSTLTLATAQGQQLRPLDAALAKSLDPDSPPRPATDPSSQLGFRLLSPDKKPTRTIDPSDIQTICDQGLELCRAGQWTEGLLELARIHDVARKSDLPSLYFSYLGFGLAKYRGQIQQGIKLCRYAIKVEFYQPENYVNLARTCMLSNAHRRTAWEAVRDGLKIDPDHPELVSLHSQIGQRRPPIMPFLDRRNPFNRLLGWLRSQSLGGGAQPLPPEPPLRRRRGPKAG
jgi:hypothetical protein